jgi:hypothetical protein
MLAGVSITIALTLAGIATLWLLVRHFTPGDARTLHEFERGDVRCADAMKTQVHSAPVTEKAQPNHGA